MKSVSAAVFCLLLGSASAAFAITVSIDPGAGPESITSAPDGGLILGSATKPTIYRAAKGETKAKPWIDVSADGAVTFLGVLSDVSTNTLWACEIGPRSAPGTPSPSTLLSFDLTSGAPKTRWKLPGDSSLCNDFYHRPGSLPLYVQRHLQLHHLPAASGFRLWARSFINNRALDGIDGVTFMDGVLYANNVFADTLWRIPMDASGKAGNPVNIWTDQPLKGPDGMRAAGGHLFVAENANGRDSMLTVTGDVARCHC